MRGVGGAAIIGVPLVYTMEVWQIATTFGARNVLLLLAVGFAVCVGYNYFSGLRGDGEGGGDLRQAAKDAVESLAIGAVLAGVLLWLLGVIDSGTSLADATHKIAAETVPLAMGASVASTQFDGGKSDREGEGENDANTSPAKQTLREVGIAAAGSLIFAASVAPTEEIARIAQRVSPLEIAGIALFSLLLSYGMIFVADFTGSQTRQKEGQGILQSPVGETVLSYTVALFVAFVAVNFFHGVAAHESLYSTVALTVTLGLPAAIGGAAGRLLI